MYHLKLLLQESNLRFWRPTYTYGTSPIKTGFFYVSPKLSGAPGTGLPVDTSVMSHF